jgi:hypothetical protein
MGMVDQTVSRKMLILYVHASNFYLKAVCGYDRLAGVPEDPQL